MGVSQTLVGKLTFENGQRQARDFDGYPFLRPGQMPQVHVRIVESGAEMGGIGEPGLPGGASIRRHPTDRDTRQRPWAIDLHVPRLRLVARGEASNQCARPACLSR